MNRRGSAESTVTEYIDEEQQHVTDNQQQQQHHHAADGQQQQRYQRRQSAEWWWNFSSIDERKIGEKQKENRRNRSLDNQDED